MPRVVRPTCPRCRAKMILASPSNDKEQRAFRCRNCDQPDPLKCEEISGWLKGELGSRFSAETE